MPTNKEPTKPKGKLNLARFTRNNQGIIDFAILIEQSDPKNREKIISQTSDQDPELINQVLKKVVYFEELIYLDEVIIAEILNNISPKVLAFALRDTEEEFRKELTGHLDFRKSRLVRDEEGDIGPNSPKDFIFGARRQILKVARKLEMQNKFIFEVPDCPRVAGIILKATNS